MYTVHSSANLTANSLLQEAQALMK